ncbi:MAG: hypothetical protein WBE66_19790, partial [Mycobacterium sp.]
MSRTCQCRRDDRVPFVKGDQGSGGSGPNANFWNTIFSSGFPVNLLSYLAQNTSAQALQGVNSQISQGVSEGEGALGHCHRRRAQGEGDAPAPIGGLTDPA